MTSSTWVVPGATSVSGLAAATPTTARKNYGKSTPPASRRQAVPGPGCLDTLPVMSLSVISVTGMTCEHCEKAVRAEREVQSIRINM